MTYRIVPVRGHFEVYINGAFYCSADNMREVETEIKNYSKGSVSNEVKSA